MKFFLLLWAFPVFAPTFEWAASQEAISGYRLYWKVGNSPMTNYVSITGRTNTTVIVNPSAAGNYVFAATSISSNGIESVFSNQITWRRKR